MPDALKVPSAEARVRLEGLDVARLLALIGMICVNFNVVMTHGAVTAGSGFVLAELFQGRAAALFVVLAGIGLGLSTARYTLQANWRSTLKRAAFLLIIGLLNAIIFEPDIIHYYAFYFVFGLLFLRAPNWLLWSAIFGLICSFVLMVILLDYDAGWNWETYTYSGFWSFDGFIRNLFFNGWHPVIPWLSFFLLGLWLSRLPLKNRRLQIRMFVWGCVSFLVFMAISKGLLHISRNWEDDAYLLFGTSPVPPMPLYLLSGGSCAVAITGGCLLIENKLRETGILPYLTAPGRHTLTLYMAHIYVGMGTLEAAGLLGLQTARTALIASLIFCAAAILFSNLWAKKYKRGPLEALMRKLTG